jgi:hypothetical protein
MNDDNELSEVRESLLAEGAGLAGVHMDRPAQAVMARGRALRLRRRLLRGLSGVTAAGAAMALVLALPLGGTATGIRQVHVTETDWSVNTGQNGTVIVKLLRVSDPLRLESVLAEAGVPATVHWGESCLAPGWGQAPPRIVTPRPAPLPVPRSKGATWRYVFSIHPALMPAHTRFVIGTRPYAKVQLRPHPSPLVTWTLIPAGAPLTCTKNPYRAAFWSAHGICAASPFASPAPSPYTSPSPSRYSSPSPSPYSSPSPGKYSSPSPSPYSSPPASPYSSPSPGPHAACTSSRT